MVECINVLKEHGNGGIRVLKSNKRKLALLELLKGKKDANGCT